MYYNKIKIKTLISVCVLLALLLAAIGLTYNPQLWQQQLSISFDAAATPWKIYLITVWFLWLLGSLCLQLSVYAIVQVCSWPQRIQEWLSVRRQQTFRATVYANTMQQLWLQQLVLNEIAELQEQAYNQSDKAQNQNKQRLQDSENRRWQALRYTLAIQHQLLGHNPYQALRLVYLLAAIDPSWGTLWYWKVIAYISQHNSGEPAPQLDQRFALALPHQQHNHASGGQPSADGMLASLPPPLLWQLAQYLYLAGALMSLQYLIKKTDWRRVAAFGANAADAMNGYAHPKEFWQLRWWQRYLVMQTQKSDLAHDSPAQLTSLWQQLPSQLQYVPEIARWWLEQLLQQGDTQNAEKYLRKFIKTLLSLTIHTPNLFAKMLGKAAAPLWFHQTTTSPLANAPSTSFNWPAYCIRIARANQSQAAWLATLEKELLPTLVTTSSNKNSASHSLRAKNASDIWFCAGQLALDLSLWGQAERFLGQARVAALAAADAPGYLQSSLALANLLAKQLQQPETAHRYQLETLEQLNQLYQVNKNDTAQEYAPH